MLWNSTITKLIIILITKLIYQNKKIMMEVNVYDAIEL